MNLSTDDSRCDPALWLLDPAITYLNHGAFGSCPRAVAAVQQEFQARLERDPIHFLVRELEPLLDDAREALARFVGASPGDLVYVPNATSGINTVLRSLRLDPGDEILITNHEYNATRNAVHFAAEMSQARVVVAPVPFPVEDEEAVIEAVLSRAGNRTRLAVLDHVTSQTGLIFPLSRLIAELTSRGIETLIDGAHAPGMVPLDLGALGATYYTGNCHKWLCAPKGAGYLYVQSDRQQAIRPLTISHAANSPRTDRSRFLLEFGWQGTGDPSAYLSVPEALRYMASLLPGGWPAVMAANHGLAVASRRMLCARLEIPEPCPTTMIGAMAALPISDASPGQPPMSLDHLQEQLFQRFRMEVPVHTWPEPPRRVLRISAQLYNSPRQYEALADALDVMLLEH